MFNFKFVRSETGETTSPIVLELPRRCIGMLLLRVLTISLTASKHSRAPSPSDLERQVRQRTTPKMLSDGGQSHSSSPPPQRQETATAALHQHETQSSAVPRQPQGHEGNTRAPQLPSSASMFNSPQIPRIGTTLSVSNRDSFDGSRAEFEQTVRRPMLQAIDGVWGMMNGQIHQHNQLVCKHCSNDLHK